MPAALSVLAALSAAAVSWFHGQGFLLYYGDAQAHLNIARRLIDSRTPNYEQIGTVWLPLPHLMMLPFVATTSGGGADWRRVPFGCLLCHCGVVPVRRRAEALESRAAAAVALESSP